jgi:putative two-component system response regulator
MLKISDKPKVLVLEDSEANVMILRTYLEAEGYQVFSEENGKTGLEMVPNIQPDLILCDIQMPGMNGLDVTKQLKSNPDTRLIPIIIITAVNEMKNKLKGIEFGAEDYLLKPFNKFELMARVNSLIKIKRLNDQYENVQNVLLTLAKAIEKRDKYTEGHSERVSLFSVRMAKKLGMNEEEQEIIRRGALLHDIGKIGIPEDVLNKPAALNDEEYEIMKKHPAIGAEITKPLKNSIPFTNMIKYHHEMYNGKGHPEGLKGKEIPLEARIVSIVDAYDAIVTTRPYRKRSSKETAFEILRNGKGQHWDPKLVDVFIEMIEEWEEDKKEKALKKKKS